MVSEKTSDRTTSLTFVTMAKIGDYYAECCLLDLYKIDSEESLSSVQERISNNDECGELRIFSSLEEAIKHLSGELSPEEELKEFKRLGWRQSQDAK